MTAPAITPAAPNLPIVNPLVQRALIASSLPGDPPVAKTSKCQAFRVTDWTFYPVAIGAVIGLIATVAAAVFALIYVAVGAGVLTLIFALGAWSIHRLSLSKAIDDQLLILATRVERMAAVVKGFQDERKEFEIQTTALTLQIDQYQKSIQDQEKQLLARGVEIANTSLKFDNAMKQLDKYAATTKTLQSQVDTLAKELQDYIKTNASLDVHIKEIAAQKAELDSTLKSLEAQNNAFSTDLQGIDKSTAEYDKNNAELVETISALGKHVKLLQTVHSTAMSSQEKIHQEVLSLKQIADKVDKNTGQMDKNNNDLQKIGADVGKKVNTLSALAELPDLIARLHKIIDEQKAGAKTK